MKVFSRSELKNHAKKSDSESSRNECGRSSEDYLNQIENRGLNFPEVIETWKETEGSYKRRNIQASSYSFAADGMNCSRFGASVRFRDFDFRISALTC
jgi:hypothetical protein